VYILIVYASTANDLIKDSLRSSLDKEFLFLSQFIEPEASIAVGET
jgi:hypothetical protein